MEFIIVNFVKVISKCCEEIKLNNILIKNHIRSFSLGDCYIKKLSINITIVKAETNDRVYELINNDLIKITEKESGITTEFENSLKFKLDRKAKVLIPETKSKEKLFGLDAIEQKLFNILNTNKFNRLVILYGPNGCGKRSLINNLELEIENKIFIKLNQNKLKERFHYLDKEILGSSAGIVLSLRLDNFSDEFFISKVHCMIEDYLEEKNTSIQIVLMLKDINSLPPKLRNPRGDKYFVRSLKDEEKAEFLRVLTGSGNDCAGEFDCLSKSLQGFTASEIKEFVNEVKQIDPNLSVQTLLECSKNRRYIPKRLLNMVTCVDELRWSDIGGYESVKRMLHEELIHSIKNSKQPIKGILFHGPPGCSKTMFVRALATESNMKLFELTPSVLMRSVLGESEQILAEFINQAVAVAPSILFIDEIDLLLPNEGEDQSGVTYRLFCQLTTFLNRSHRVLFVAATNRIGNLNKSLIRPGRIDKLIKIDLPDQQSREAILKLIFSDKKFTVDADVIASIPMIAGKLSNRSGADIAEFGRKLKKISDKEFPLAIRMEHLIGMF